VILSLVGLSYRVAKSGTRATDQALSMAVLLAKVDRASTTAFDNLPALAGCDTILSSSVKVIGCIQVTSLSLRLDSLRIIVRTSLPGARPDTVNMQLGTTRLPVPLR
jgi:hypothetical protein